MISKLATFPFSKTFESDYILMRRNIFIWNLHVKILIYKPFSATSGQNLCQLNLFHLMQNLLLHLPNPQKSVKQGPGVVRKQRIQSLRVAVLFATSQTGLLGL